MDRETATPAIDRAIAVTDQEIERVEREKQALQDFTNRVREIDTSRLQSPPCASTLPTTIRHRSVTSPEAESHSGLGHAQEAVVDAYRETIVALDHFDDEYGNSVPVDIANELGADVFRGLFVDPELTTYAFRLLVARARAAVRSRSRLAETVLDEQQSLITNGEELTAIRIALADVLTVTAGENSSAATIRDELDEIEAQCQEIILNRQDTLHSYMQTINRTGERISLNEYLYQDSISVSCPVLHDAIDISRNSK